MLDADSKHGSSHRPDKQVLTLPNFTRSATSNWQDKVKVTVIGYGIKDECVGIPSKIPGSSRGPINGN